MQKKNAYIEKNINILDLDKSIVEVFRKNDIVTIEQLWVLNRKKLKELGLCTSCGKRPTKHNKVYCEYCGARVRERQRKAYLLNIYATKSMAEIRV